MRKLSGQVVVVTGASQGVGRAVARALAVKGAKVGLIARGIDGLEGAAREVRALGGEALVLPLDVSDADAVFAAADRVVAQWGRIDGWINDAMVSVFSPVSQMRPEEYRRVTEVTYLGSVHGTLAALKHMQRQNAGTIVQVGSAVSYRSIPLQSAYCAAKAATRGFIDSLRCELLHDQSPIRLAMVHLPAVNTPQFDVARSRLPRHPAPLGPIFQPEVAAQAVIHALRHPSRELWVGAPTVLAMLGQRLAPGLLDRSLARRAWDAQQSSSLPAPQGDNLDAPLPGNRGAHGPFDAGARRGSVELWLRRHPISVALGVLAMLGARRALR